MRVPNRPIVSRCRSVFEKTICRKQGRTLGQLGNLYDEMGRLEEAVTFNRQAAEMAVRLKDTASEGLAPLQPGPEANQAQTSTTNRDVSWIRAIECAKSSGHAAEPWKNWGTAEELEWATDHVEAARAARHQAIESYQAYRRAGGVSQRTGLACLQWSSKVFSERDAGDPRVPAASQRDPEAPVFVKTLAGKLEAVLAGNRNPDLAGDNELEYVDAAELLLLLEHLK